MKLVSSAFFLIITCYGMPNNADNLMIRTEIIKVFEVECLDGYHHYHPYPYDCQKYYSCENGTLEVKECPPEMNWNDDIKSCDLEDNIYCFHAITTDEGTSSTASTPTTTEGPHTTQKVECTGEHQYFPYPYDCSKYYECSNDKAYLLNCPENQYWDNDAKMCDWSWNVDCVASSPPPTSETSTASTPSTTVPAPTPKIECTGEHQFYPYPYDCSKYYECSDNKAYLLTCPENQFWDNEARMCDWSWNVDCVTSTLASYAVTQKQ